VLIILKSNNAGCCMTFEICEDLEMPILDWWNYYQVSYPMLIN